MRDLTNQVMIITGASSGIGAATAIAAAKAGMDVVLNARREEKLRDVAAQVHGLGRKAQVVSGDVIEPGISERMLDAAIERFGRFDAVFANAGYGCDCSIIDLTDQHLREMFEVNFFSGVDLLRRAAQRLLAANSAGHLLMCSSCLAKMTFPNSGLYCATKAAQNHICRAMNMELKHTGIRVASVHPVGTRTEFFEVSAQRSGTSIHAPPRMFMQPPERVANAIIRCLHRPRPEVWTSFSTRLGAAVMTLAPRFADWMMARAHRSVSGQ